MISLACFSAFTSRLVDVTLTVELSLTEACEQTRHYVASLARSRFSTISAMWQQGLCGPDICANVSVTCPSVLTGAPYLTAVFTSIRSVLTSSCIRSVFTSIRSVHIYISGQSSHLSGQSSYLSGQFSHLSGQSPHLSGQSSHLSGQSSHLSG